jgi:hypothetical protein
MKDSSLVIIEGSSEAEYADCKSTALIYSTTVQAAA